MGDKTQKMRRIMKEIVTLHKQRIELLKKSVELAKKEKAQIGSLTCIVSSWDDIPPERKQEVSRFVKIFPESDK